MPGTTDTQAPPPLRLTQEQQGRILAAAAGYVAGAVRDRPAFAGEPDLAGAEALPVSGAYVTLKRRGHLRACCGTINTPKPLGQVLRHAAITTARDDRRLPPVSMTELPYLDLSVNLVHGFERVTAEGRDRVGAVQVGRHGLRILQTGGGGLLLPGVAVERGWDAESFLRQVCTKAGLPTTAWEDPETSLSTFETVEFGGPFDLTALGTEPAGLVPPRPSLPGQVADGAKGNLVAMLRGSAPSYYLTGVEDGNVSGVALTVATSDREGPEHLFQLSFRPPLPFQATLFGLCEAAAAALARRGPVPRSLRVGVTILTDPAMHGTAADHDLRGLDPDRRALLMIDQGKTYWTYAPGSTPEDLLARLLGDAAVLDPAHAGLYSLEARSTERAVTFGPAPGATADARGARPPAVAGKFYPADPGALTRQIDGLLAATERRPDHWPAAMVPHAGLRYSGGVAAAVFNRLHVPDLVLVVGPKHTRNGAAWAVAPQDAWSIPGATLPADPGLARALADAIPGLRLDAEAHRLEHAIEVELPFLARLNPRARVVGLAVGGGDWDHCRAFAAGLADVLRGLPEPPLLLISSDMNHFAPDKETRRLDETALAAMERLVPAELLATVAEHQVSMCGVLPAVIVMETLHLLGGLRACERVAYATSADAGADPGRVVGYAGILLR